ncbi:MAG: hypothetical protein ABIO83_04740 [Ilumatobacteraceae bacterium]
MDDHDAASRRSRLLGLKLRALVRDHLADDVDEAVTFAPGAALLHDGTAWVYLDHRPGERLGAALAFAIRSGADRLHVIAESETGTLARRAAWFTLPIEVWHAEGRTLLPAVAEPLPVEAAVPDAHQSFVSLITEGGAIPNDEHGVMFGEVRGLEVCRVVHDGALDTDRLEVGVGAHDREAFQMMHGDVPTVMSLARIVDTVQQHREIGAVQHPLNRLGAERFIRWRIEQDPSLVGAVEMRPASPPLPRPNLKDPVPCVALGTEHDGRPVLVVCSSGVDLDLVPFVVDARAAAVASHPEIADRLRVVVATPARDRLPLTDQLASLLVHPVEFVALDPTGPRA